MAANIRLADALSLARSVCRRAMSRASELIGGQFVPWYDPSKLAVEEGEHEGRGARKRKLSKDVSRETCSSDFRLFSEAMTLIRIMFGYRMLTLADQVQPGENLASYPVEVAGAGGAGL